MAVWLCLPAPSHGVSLVQLGGVWEPCLISGVSLLETIVGQVYIGSERQTLVALPLQRFHTIPLAFCWHLCLLSSPWARFLLGPSQLVEMIVRF